MTSARALAAAALALAFAFVLALVTWPAPAAASDGLGTVEVSIVDRAGGAAIDGAHVTLFGPQSVVRLSDGTGTLRFEDVPPGVYVVRARAQRYGDGESARFDVAAGDVVRVKVELERALVEIGRVKALPAASVTVTTVDDSSATRRISDTLLDALQNIAGVSMQRGADGSSGIALRGFDRSQTGFRIDGLDVAGGISSAAFSAGLFSGASVDFSPTAGSLGGTASFQTINPTKAWTERGEASYGTFDRSTYLVSASGTSGKLGIALQHSWRGSDSPLSGRTYADFSGLSYAHDGGTRADGDVFKLVYAPNAKTTFRLSALRAGSSGSDLCTDDTTILPCGYGPGITSFDRFNYLALVGQSLVGNVAVTAAAYASATTSDYDAGARYVGGVAEPYYATTRALNHGLSLTASATSSRHTRTASFFAYGGSNTSLQIASGDATPSASAVSGYRASLTDAYAMGAHLTTTGSVSLAGATGIGSAVLGSLRGEWRPRRDDSVSFAVASGVSSPNLARVTTYSDPRKAQVDCFGRSAFVQGPGDDPAPQSSTSVQLGARHAWARGEIRVSAYQSTVRGTPFLGAVPLVGGGAALPDGYLGAIAQTWNAPTVCGTIAFAPSRVFAYESLSGVAQRYAGATTDGKVQLGRAAAAFWSYGVTSATITSVDPRLAARGFVFEPGRQLPGRPLQTGSLTLSALQPRAGLEYIANLRYVGAANQQNLPPYAVVNLGVVIALRHGTLSLLDSNAFGTDAGDFTTSRGINPFRLADGTTVAFPSTPLPPRQLTLRYAVRAGR